MSDAEKGKPMGFAFGIPLKQNDVRYLETLARPRDTTNRSWKAGKVTWKEC
jgi:hypothetical protein